MKKRSNLIFLLLAVLLTLPTLWGILHQGFFLSDDGNWMVIRFSAFYDSLKNGQFPVRFLSRLNNGYGYPVADFLYPLFMYVGVPIHILGFSFVGTIKIIFALSMILSSVFSFLWLRKIFDNMSSLVGSVIYSFFPYHLWDLYKRGSVGEVLALAVVPFIFWQLERKSFIWTSIGIALLILAHNSLAVIFLPVVVLYMALNILITKDKLKLLSQNFAEIVLGLCLSAFFWLPAIYDIQYTVFSKTQVSNWRNYFADVNLIGLSTVFIIALTFVLVFVGKIKFKKHRLTMLLLTVCIVSIFLAIPISFDVWNMLPVSFIQFPFRFLSISAICIAFLAACVVSVFKDRAKIIIIFSIFALTFLSVWPFLFPKQYQYHADSFYSTNQDSTTVRNEYMPKWIDHTLMGSSYSRKAEIVKGKAEISNLINKGNKISFKIDAEDESIAQINTVYFPGWEVVLDGKTVSIDYNSNGLIRFDVPAGSHLAYARFGETNVRIIADSLSIVGLLLIVALLVRNKFIKT